MDFSIFDEQIDRKNTSSLKWDALHDVYMCDDLLPMWVADMDFPSPDCIQQALIERIKHPVLGYTIARESVYSSIVHWLDTRHNWNIDKNWITFSSGVVASLSTSILAYTNPGDRVLIQSPVYTPFFNIIEKNSREVVNNELLLKNNRYTIDFLDFEEKLKSGVKLLLLSNPHNPGGRIWTKNELQKIGELCVKYNVIIVSDEIHADLIHSPYKHHPIASLHPSFAEKTVTLMAPSKTFNIAGIQASFMITSNKQLQLKFKQVQASHGFHGLNLFALTAMEAAYRDGLEWLLHLLTYIEENVKVAETFITSEIPNLQCIHPEASYLLWIDCRELGLTDKEIQTALIQKGRLALEPGEKYGSGGEGFIRMNLGCSRSLLLDGLYRLKLAFSKE